MYKELLSRFLEEHKPVSELPTVAAIAHFRLKALVIPDKGDVRDVMETIYNETMPERLEEAAQEKSEIENISVGSELVRIMRRNVDPLNDYAVVAKAMELENEVVPEVLRRFKNNRTNRFIELAVQVLGKTRLALAETMIGYYDEMQNPYGQSMVLLLAGFKADENRIPWIISKYHEMKKNHPSKDYHECAWYGLLEMHIRFYDDVVQN